MIEVAVPVPVFNTYTYGVPKDLADDVVPGVRVLIPFGKRKLAGYVLGSQTVKPAVRIMDILEVIDPCPLFPDTMVPFFRWMARYYIHPIGEVISEALPSGINPAEMTEFTCNDSGREVCEENKVSGREKSILSALFPGPMRKDALCRALSCEIPVRMIRKMEQNGWIRCEKKMVKGRTRVLTERYACLLSTAIPESGLSAVKQDILDFLAKNSPVPVSDLKQVVKTAATHIRHLEKIGLVRIIEKPVYRDPFGEKVLPDTPPELTLEQKLVVRNVSRAMGEGFCAYLLAGVTGSGKTEVYMRLADEALKRDKSVLVLVPEIALISEVERRFRARFGECVAVLHSGLSAGERHDQWLRIASGAAPIAIGARSAVFAPLMDPGIIIVDEEHDTSYKQENRLRYNARDMAVVRAKLAGAVVLLGSATPSIQSVHNVLGKKYIELNLTKRIHSRALPEVEVVDLRKYKAKRGVDRFITPELHQAATEALGRGEQILLFLNRRGFATYPVCAQCGQPLKCRHCDITLTLHKKANIYKCHMCGYFKAATSLCENCGSPSIKQLGLGTEKIEAAAQKLFPQARIARLDRDSTAKKGALIKTLKSLRNREIDILVGTQMVAKGHDFPNITVVGIICADSSLSFPDFRAGELTFQVLAQVAGRAGRGERPGRVILQTYSPDHFAIESAKKQDFMCFFNQEIGFRRALSYPPFSRLAQVRISGRDKTKTARGATEAGLFCHRSQKQDQEFKLIEILGPIEAPITKIAGSYRWQILVKAPGADILRRFLTEALFKNGFSQKKGGVLVDVDIDPFYLM
ncbi:MAG: primosomal protein N' [Deltaproteobacteria bacterium]|nr:primosomal protein N' [Deltaproteobacteria bacterium]